MSHALPMGAVAGGKNLSASSGVRSRLSSQSPDQLHERALDVARDYKRVESDLLDILQRIDGQRAFLALGYPSLFEYAVRALDLTEAVAFSFIRVARKAREIPEMKEEISAGRLTVAKASRIASIVTSENKAEWIMKAIELPKQDLEREVVRVAPELAKREVLRQIGVNTFRLHLGLDSSIAEKLKRAQTLMAASAHKNLNLEETIDRVLDEYLKRKDPLKKGMVSYEVVAVGVDSKASKSPSKEAELCPRVATEQAGWLRESIASGFSSKKGELCPGRVDSRSVTPVEGGKVVSLSLRSAALSATLRGEVLRRDQSRCQYVSNKGKKCLSQRFVEVHHAVPVSEGGQDKLENLITLCWAHHHWWHLQHSGMAPP